MENISLIATIGLWIVGILLSVIGFFLMFYFKRSVKSDDELNKSVSKLQQSITGLNGTILAQEDRFTDFQVDCKDRHKNIDVRLDKHENKLENHEGRIIKVETKLGTKN